VDFVKNRLALCLQNSDTHCDLPAFSMADDRTPLGWFMCFSHFSVMHQFDQRISDTYDWIDKVLSDAKKVTQS
jgi:hypothetical protein